jgi:hypothetical protein
MQSNYSPVRGDHMAHMVYRAIVTALRIGKLKEPFSITDFKKACPGLGGGTYQAFLYKHREGNPGGNSELFGLISPGLFKCLRPIKYGI